MPVPSPTGSAPRRRASLRAKGLAVLLVPTLGLVAVAAALVLVERRSRATGEVVAQASEMRVSVQRVLTLLVDAETGVRGYVATRDAVFLEPYERARRELPVALAALERAERESSDDPAPLFRLVETELSQLASLRAIADDPAAPPEVLVERARAGKATMDAIRAWVTGVIRSHEAVQRAQEADTRRLDALTSWMVLGIVSVGVVGGIGIAVLFYKRVVSRVEHARANARRLAAGEPPADGAWSNDELGDLNRSLGEAAALIASERARLDLAMEMGRVFVFQIDGEHHVVDARGQLLPEAGTLDAALAFIHERDREQVLAALETVRTRGEAQDFSVELADGAGFVAGRITRVELPGGGSVVLGVSVDVTEVRRAEEALRDSERRRAADALSRVEQRGRHNELVLASAGEGIFAVDAQGRCTSMNPAAARMLGYDPGELVGVRLHDVIHHSRVDGTPYSARRCPIYRSMATGNGVRVEGEVYWCRDGTPVFVDYSSFPLTDDGSVRGAVVTFTDATERHRVEAALAETASELREAIAAGQLVLHYQPKIDLATGSCDAVEALVRWQRADRLVYPDQFIPQAEQAGVIDDLTTCVITQGVRQAAAWRRAGLNLRVAVNLSALSLADERMAERIAVAAGAAGVPASCLEVEVTETTLAEDTDSVLRNLAHFRAMGVRSAIDDFGTGFSSLSYLKHLTVDYIKIDKSFVMNMTSDGRDQSIVGSTIHLAHALGMRVVAEGVENAGVMRALGAAGCDIGQGYHWTRPLAPAELECWLAGRPVPSSTPRSTLTR